MCVILLTLAHVADFAEFAYLHILPKRACAALFYFILHYEFETCWFGGISEAWIGLLVLRAMFICIVGGWVCWFRHLGCILFVAYVFVYSRGSYLHGRVSDVSDLCSCGLVVLGCG